MKNIQLIITCIVVICASIISSAAFAQCPSNKVMISNNGYVNGSGRLCPPCVTKCVPQNQVQKYLASGWITGPCTKTCVVFPPQKNSAQKKTTNTRKNGPASPSKDIVKTY